MSRGNILLLVAILIALTGWYRYYQEHTSARTLQTEFQAMESESSLVMGQVKDYASQIAELEQRLDTATSSNSETTDTAALASTLKSAQAEKLLLEDENKALEAQLTAVKEELKAMSAQPSVEPSDIENTRQQLAKAVRAREELEAALLEAQSRSEQTSTLEEQLRMADREILTHTNSLERERSRAADLEQELLSLTQGKELLESDIDEKKNQLTRLTEEQERAQEQIRLLKDEIEVIAKQSALEVETLKDQVTLIRMDSDIVFEPGSTRLKPAGNEVLLRVAAFAERMPDRIISLEGHTDNVRIAEARRDYFPSNWELSAARAASAARLLEDNGVDPVRLRIVGYGPNQPVAQNDTEDGRRRNRRLEIRLIPATQIESKAAP